MKRNIIVLVFICLVISVVFLASCDLSTNDNANVTKKDELVSFKQDMDKVENDSDDIAENDVAYTDSNLHIIATPYVENNVDSENIESKQSGLDNENVILQDNESQTENNILQEDIELPSNLNNSENFIEEEDVISNEEEISESNENYFTNEEVSHEATKEDDNTNQSILNATEEISSCVHDYGNLIPALQPTCEDIGNIAYYECSKCNQYFNENKKVVTNVFVDALKHNEGYVCSRCGLADKSNFLFTINEDEESYNVTGAIEDAKIFRIPSTYEDLKVTAINASAFSGLNVLEEVVIPNGVLTIGANAFNNCSSLTSVKIGDSVTSISSYAFSNCTSLKHVVIPNTVTIIDYTSFSNCSNIEEVSMPGSAILYIPKNNLKTVILTNGEIINAQAFENCTKLTSITIPRTVNTIDSNAFKGCISLESVYVRDISRWCSIAFENEFANPLYYAENLYLYAIYDEKIGYEYKVVENLSLSDSLSKISDYAFYNYDKLKSITLDSVKTTIKDYSFASCDSLETIILNGVLASVGVDAFKDCSSLNSVYLLTIEDWCSIDFANFYSNPLYYANDLYLFDENLNNEDNLLNYNLVTKLVIPTTVTEIKDYAFYKFEALESITVLDSVNKIGEWTFYGCLSIEDGEYNEYKKGYYIGNKDNPYLILVEVSDDIVEYNIHKTTKFVSTYAFSDCIFMNNIKIEKSVISIGDMAFLACYKLEEITLGDAVTIIGNNAFASCHSLESINISNAVTSIGCDVFRNSTNLVNINYAGTVAEWNLISKDKGWDSKTGDYTVYCTNGQISKYGTVTLN